MTINEAFATIKCACFGNPTELSEAFDTLKKAIESQQKTDKTGHWIVYMDDIWFCCECSECSKVTSFRYIYCPNCGVKMEKEYEQRETN